MLLPKEKLEKLQRLIVMNSLSMTKGLMFAKAGQAVAKVTHALQWLPALEVDKKEPQ